MSGERFAWGQVIFNVAQIMWHVRCVLRGRAIDHRTLRENQADLPFRAAPVIVCTLLAGDAAWRHGARHRRPYDTVSQREILNSEGAGQHVVVEG
jgi:hypothetical protein